MLDKKEIRSGGSLRERGQNIRQLPVQSVRMQRRLLDGEQGGKEGKMLDEVEMVTEYLDHHGDTVFRMLMKHRLKA